MDTVNAPLPKIIGISGKIGAGKDTAAAFIQEAYPHYTVIPFAANVKKVVSIITGTTEEENYTREGKAKIPEGFDKSLGTYQQIIGQSYRDIVSPQVWVRAVMNRPEEYKLIPDVRYDSEVDAIEAAGGIVIRIVRKDELRMQSVASDGRDHNHSSEIALDKRKFKICVYNNGTLDDLKRMTLQAMFAKSIG